MTTSVLGGGSIIFQYYWLNLVVLDDRWHLGWWVNYFSILLGELGCPGQPWRLGQWVNYFSISLGELGRP